MIIQTSFLTMFVEATKDIITHFHMVDTTFWLISKHLFKLKGKSPFEVFYGRVSNRISNREVMSSNAVDEEFWVLDDSADEEHDVSSSHFLQYPHPFFSKILFFSRNLLSFWGFGQLISLFITVCLFTVRITAGRRICLLFLYLLIYWYFNNSNNSIEWAGFA